MMDYIADYIHSLFRDYFPAWKNVQGVTMNDVPNYTHSPIKDRYIRVIRLRRADTCIGGRSILQGTLRPVCLRRPGTFDAISYACEDQGNSEYILIDGKKVGITKNCSNGLRHLRDEFGVRTIWVDSVCIAADKAEKNRQLPLMTDIYGKARKVYIWLGEPSEGGVSERALDWLEAISLNMHPLLGVRLSDFPKNMHPWELAKAISLIPQIVRAWMRRLGLSSHVRDYDHEAMRDIIDRTWFTRMWTIQEAAMAERPVVVCGKKEIRWNCLVWGVLEAWNRADESTRGEFLRIVDSISTMYLFWLEISRVSEFSAAEHQNSDSWFYNKRITVLRFMGQYGLKLCIAQMAVIAATITARFWRGLRPVDSVSLLVLILVCLLTVLLIPSKTGIRWNDNLRSMLVNVVSKSRRQESTEPKDKVYALYGLLKNLGISPPEADYSPRNSLEDTYLGFTHSIIQWHHSLAILREASGPWGSNAPSWVPDWSRPYRQLQILDGKASTKSPSETNSSSYTFSENLRELTVYGKKIGTMILRVGFIEGSSVKFDVNESSISSTQFLSHLNNVTTLREWLNSVRGFFPSMDVLYDFLASTPDFQNTYTASGFCEWAEVLLKDKLAIPHHRIQSFMSVPVSVEKGRRVIQEIRSHDIVSTGLEWRILLILATREKLWQLHQAVCSILAEQATIFVAKVQNSYLLGEGPHHCQKGDNITLLPTLETPMILRAVDNAGGKFHLMGVVYIPQLPWDELWPKDETKRESIILI